MPPLFLCVKGAGFLKRCAHDSIEVGDAIDAEGLFARLSAGGRVTVAFAKQHWGRHYGNFTDRFGVPWAVGCAET